MPLIYKTMGVAMLFAQYLPYAVVASGIAALSLILLLSIRKRLLRSRSGESSRAFIKRVREDHGMKNSGYTTEAPNEIRNTQANTRTSRFVSTKVEDMADAKNFSPSTAEALVDFEQTVKRLTAQLDNRAAMLDKMIRDADDRLRLLDIALDSVPGASISPSKIAHIAEEARKFKEQSVVELESYQTPQTENATAEPTSAYGSSKKNNGNGNRNAQPDIVVTPAASESVHTDRQLDGSKGHTHTNAQVNTNEDTSSNTQPDTSEPAQATDSPEPVTIAISSQSMIDPLSASVYELADRGRTPVQIAQYLDEQVGKIELIIALRPEY